MSENKVSYAGQVVVITGAARGIGAATARLVAERGGQVFALDIARDGLTALQKNYRFLITKYPPSILAARNR